MMKCCTFCTNEAEKLFNHPTHHIGLLCTACYMQLHGSCGVCDGSLMPAEINEEVNYRVKARFISMGEEKSFVVCEGCYEAIRREYSEQFA
jgi:hypothetical protein